jgi:putative nucleotidyltransferase with HDIG domain
MAQALSAVSLYSGEHPASARAVDRAYQALSDLQDEQESARFTFVGDEIVFGARPLRELRGWDWGKRLGAAGVQRLELTERVEPGDFEAFLDELAMRLGGGPVRSAEVRQGRPSSIRYGEVAVQGESEVVEEERTPPTSYSLQEEIDTVGWVQEELKEGRRLQMLEAEGIVRSLSVAMHADQAFLIPLVRLKEFDQYTVTHTLNVSVLTMALTEFLGLGPREVRAFGIAGLLHDLGKVRIPVDILNKPGKLSDREREVMNSHTVEGARLILEAEEELDMAAVVAYEHHIRIDGSGYPALRYKRACHHASDLVHVCDVFDALRTHRPYRAAMSAERAVSIIEEGAGTEFDADIAHAFVKMMDQWEHRVSEISMEDPELRLDPRGPSDGHPPIAGDPLPGD